LRQTIPLLNTHQLHVSKETFKEKKISRFPMVFRGFPEVSPHAKHGRFPKVSRGFPDFSVFSKI
jgi:hypothetical protein